MKKLKLLFTKYSLLAAVLYIQLGYVYAQERRITGTVTDKEGEGLPGATVMLKNDPNKGTITDLDGSYAISASEGDVIVFSFIGFQSKEMKVDGRTVMDVVLSDDVQALEEVVVVGYGSQQKKDVTGAVGTVSAAELNEYPVSNVSQAMQGRMAGVQVSNSTEPGGGVKVRIRGVGTITGSADPIYVVDGTIMTELNNINPNDIESMSVLKDASAAAIYGSRAANGVVIITTKSGTPGKTTFSANMEYGIQDPINLYEVMNTAEYQDYARTFFTSPGKTPSEDDLRWVDDDELAQTNTNWAEEIFRPAPIQRYSIAASGGSDASRYRVSLGYFDQEGLQRTTGFKRYNIALNSQIGKGILKIGQSLNAYYSERRRAGRGTSVFVMNIPPQIPVYAETLPLRYDFENNEILYRPGANGGYGVSTDYLAGSVNSPNAVALHELVENVEDVYGFNGNVFLEAEILEGLSVKTSLNATGSFLLTRDQNPNLDQGNASYASYNSRYGETRRDFIRLISENTISYRKFVGEHFFNVLAGYTIQNERSTLLYSNLEGFKEGIKTVNGGITGNSLNEKHMLSYLGRLNYSFKDRFLFTASLRRDGSSKFPVNRVGYFPSFSTGWRISDESFMTGVDFVSNLKLRAGYGELGRDLDLGDNVVPTIAPFAIYPFPGGTSTTGGILNAVDNPEIRWETVKQYNIGLDASFFNNRVSLTADAFRKISEDMLLNVEYPANYGVGIHYDMVGGAFRNIGSMINEGLEFSASYQKSEGALTYSINGNFTYIQNTVSELYQINGETLPIIQNSVQRAVPDQSLFHFYGYRTDGIFKDQNEIDNYTAQDEGGRPRRIQPDARPGEVRYVDVNGDGQITDQDQTNLGRSLPKYFYGMSLNAAYKGFDLSILFEGKADFKVYNQNLRDLTATNQKFNRSRKLINNTWTPENTDAFYPVIGANSASFEFSDRFLSDGAYLMMKNIQLGYNFNIPGEIIQSLRAYIGVTNVFILTNYEGYNPDVWDQGDAAGSSIEFQGNARPTPRVFTTGIQLQF